MFLLSFSWGKRHLRPIYTTPLPWPSTHAKSPFHYRKKTLLIYTLPVAYNNIEKFFRLLTSSSSSRSIFMISLKRISSSMSENVSFPSSRIFPTLLTTLCINGLMRFCMAIDLSKVCDSSSIANGITAIRVNTLYIQVKQ